MFLVPDPERPRGEKRVSKLLLQISICTLHNDLISEGSIYQLKESTNEKRGKRMISDTSLCAFIPNNAQNITDRDKYMCGCKICVMIYTYKHH